MSASVKICPWVAAATPMRRIPQVARPTTQIMGELPWSASTRTSKWIGVLDTASQVAPASPLPRTCSAQKAHKAGCTRGAANTMKW
eukprot:scaffold92693_cov61-Phaeocystis_antarctica.AAC.4